MNKKVKGIITIFGQHSSERTNCSIDLISKMITDNDTSLAIFSLDQRSEQITSLLKSKLEFSKNVYVEDNIGVYLPSFLEDAIFFKRKSKSNRMIILIDYFQKLNFEFPLNTNYFEDELKFLLELLKRISDQENVLFIINSKNPKHAQTSTHLIAASDEITRC